MLCSTLFHSIPIRLARVLTEYRKPATFYSALFHSGMPAPHDIPCPPLPAASRCCNALFCHTPFNSIPACAHFRLTAASPCHSILLCFIPAAPPNLPDLPCRPPVGAAMFCSAPPVQIHSGLLTYRLTAANPCRFILLCLIPASPAIPYLLPVHTAPKPIDSVHQSQPKTHTQHISPSLLRATPN